MVNEREASNLFRVPAPISVEQEQILFGPRSLSPSNGMCSITFGFRIISNRNGHTLSIERLRRALRALIRKHTALRTALSADATGTCLQSIVPIIDDEQLLFELTVMNIDDHEDIRRIEAHIQHSMRFDLEMGRLLHCHILHRRLLSEVDTVLFSIHRSAFDSISKSIFFRDLTIAYDADEDILFVDDVNSLQYIDYAIYERAMDINASHDFWRLQMVGYDFPHRRVNHESVGGPITVDIPMDDDLACRFLDYMRVHQVTPFQLGLAIFYVFLFQLSNGEKDLCVTCLQTNRNRPELLDVIGLFQTYLPYRLQFDPQNSFDQLLERVRHQCLTAAHFVLPPPDLPLPDVMFSFIALPANHDQAILDGLLLEPISLLGLETEAKCHLMCSLTYDQSVANHQISWSFTCARNSSDLEAIQASMEQYSSLVRHLLTSNQFQPLSRLLILTSNQQANEQDETDRLSNVNGAIPSVTSHSQQLYNTYSQRHLFPDALIECDLPPVVFSSHAFFSSPPIFTNQAFVPDPFDTDPSVQLGLIPKISRSISAPIASAFTSHGSTIRRAKSRYVSLEAKGIDEGERHSLLVQENIVETDPKEETTTELHLPNIPDPLLVLRDEHDRVIFTSQYTCRQIIEKIRNWEKLREFFVDNIQTDSIGNEVSRYIIRTVQQLKPSDVARVMLKLCAYREAYVNDLFEQLMQLFPNQLLIENESGSRDPESDYDVSLASSDGTDADIDACVMFNQFFSRHWSLPSSLVFDTNLYPRHLNTIEPKFHVQGTGLGIFLHLPCDYPYYFFNEVNDYKQNKMSVIKLRKYMTGLEWQRYVATIVQDDSDPSLTEFFRTADRTYWKYTQRLLRSISDLDPLITSALLEITNILPMLDYPTYDTTNFELLWTRIEHELKPLIIEQGNRLFIFYLRQARQIERAIRNRKDRYEDSILNPILRIPLAEMLYIDALIVSMRHKFAKAVYFASETCVAEGSLFYTGIEQYNNHADQSFVKNRNLRTNLITNNQLYQSINEQYSGFLKDIKHYSKKQVHDGRIIYRSSKYLYRLLSTMVDSSKNQWNRMGNDRHEEMKNLKTKVEQLLLSIRKCKYPFDGLSSIDRAQISECFALGIFATHSQLEKYWAYRRLLLDSSSALFKYRETTWGTIPAPDARLKIRDLLTDDMKTWVMHRREEPDGTWMGFLLCLTQFLLRTDGFPRIDECQNSVLIEMNPSHLVHTPSSVEQFQFIVGDLVLECNEKIYHSHSRGLLDSLPDLVRYLFDWNRSRFNIVTRYARQEEYRRVKRSRVEERITLQNYVTGVLFGILLGCIQMCILAPILFLIRPIQKSVWIVKTVGGVRQPSDRLLLNIRAAYLSLTTGNISVVHDWRIIDTGVTIDDSYGTRRWVSDIIGLMRLLSITLIEGIVWFSWVTVMMSIIGLMAISVLLNYLYIVRNAYIVCSIGVCLIDSVLNTWTTIRRHLLLNDLIMAQSLATIRENQRTRASYLSMLFYILLGVLLNTILLLLDPAHARHQWIDVIPFAKIIDTRASHFSSLQLIALVITQGVANTFIGVINSNAAGEGRLPDFELSCRARIDRKEWLNFPIGTICSVLKFRARRRDQDKR